MSNPLSDGNQNLDRIMSGIYAPGGVFSYMAALRNKTQGVICGGSIIRNIWIISAATCQEYCPNCSIYSVLRIKIFYFQRDVCECW